ncbi:hypothetical protein [Piscicoccus intestinalis]|uniref:hypothetical protein n=1 Tax=Piscicoccus intestinalis TaxID=746033 RepID=UPI0008394481|nr:hypothetical protein [Piscicoccus intestinalis]
MAELGLTVRELAIYPVKDEPGRRLERTEIEEAGLAGDRRKKRPVHVVAGDETPETTRANIFLAADPEALTALVGSRARVGSAVLYISEKPTNCPGVYAVVAKPGAVAVGDRLHPAPPAD